MMKVAMVTDHALVRYIERVLGFDLEEYGSNDHERLQRLRAEGVDLNELRNQIFTKTVQLGCELGANFVRRHDSILVIRHGWVITVLPKEARPKCQDYRSPSSKKLTSARGWSNE